MNTPAGYNAFLHELELTGRTKLALAETGHPEEQAASRSPSGGQTRMVSATASATVVPLASGPP
jgi:hypothetical protein